MRPLALDLYCGAGGASAGLAAAGFDVVGVDNRRQPRYPFRFVQADAREPPLDLGAFTLIWASPPCQHASSAARPFKNKGRDYPDLIPATRELLARAAAQFGALTVIENVPQAAIRADAVLDGSMFPALRVVRRRHFELNFRAPYLLGMPPHGLVSKHGYACVVGNGTTSWLWRRGIRNTASGCRTAMGIDWMTRVELSQAIPPPYAELIGRAALESLRAK